MNNINPMRNFWTLLFLIIFLFVLGCNLGWFDKTKYKDFCGKFKFSFSSRSKTSERRFQQVLSRYTKQWGEPQKIKLTKDEWIEACQVKPGDKIIYLALETFWAKGENDDDVSLWKSAISKEYWYKFDSGDMEGDDTPVYFKMNKKPITVYVWKNIDITEMAIK